jgi:hypothetical protein
MFSESVCQVARSWVDVGSFHTRLFIVFMICTAPVRNILDIPSHIVQNVLPSADGCGAAAGAPSSDRGGSEFDCGRLF